MFATDDEPGPPTPRSEDEASGILWAALTVNDEGQRPVHIPRTVLTLTPIAAHFRVEESDFTVNVYYEDMAHLDVFAELGQVIIATGGIGAAPKREYVVLMNDATTVRQLGDVLEYKLVEHRTLRREATQRSMWRSATRQRSSVKSHDGAAASRRLADDDGDRAASPGGVAASSPTYTKGRGQTTSGGDARLVGPEEERSKTRRNPVRGGNELGASSHPFSAKLADFADDLATPTASPVRSPRADATTLLGVVDSERRQRPQPSTDSGARAAFWGGRPAAEGDDLPVSGPPPPRSHETSAPSERRAVWGTTPPATWREERPKGPEQRPPPEAPEAQFVDASRADSHWRPASVSPSRRRTTTPPRAAAVVAARPAQRDFILTTAASPQPSPSSVARYPYQQQQQQQRGNGLLDTGRVATPAGGTEGAVAPDPPAWFVHRRAEDMAQHDAALHASPVTKQQPRFDANTTIPSIRAAPSAPPALHRATESRGATPSFTFAEPPPFMFERNPSAQGIQLGSVSRQQQRQPQPQPAGRAPQPSGATSSAPREPSPATQQHSAVAGRPTPPTTQTSAQQPSPSQGNQGPPQASPARAPPPAFAPDGSPRKAVPPPPQQQQQRQAGAVPPASTPDQQSMSDRRATLTPQQSNVSRTRTDDAAATVNGDQSGLWTPVSPSSPNSSPKTRPPGPASRPQGAASPTGAPASAQPAPAQSAPAPAQPAQKTAVKIPPPPTPSSRARTPSTTAGDDPATSDAAAADRSMSQSTSRVVPSNREAPKSASASQSASVRHPPASGPRKGHEPPAGSGGEGSLAASQSQQSASFSHSYASRPATSPRGTQRGASPQRQQREAVPANRASPNPLTASAAATPASRTSPPPSSSSAAASTRASPPPQYGPRKVPSTYKGPAAAGATGTQTAPAAAGAPKSKQPVQGAAKAPPAWAQAPKGGLGTVGGGAAATGGRPPPPPGFGKRKAAH